MSVCKTLIRTSLLSIEHHIQTKNRNLSSISLQTFSLFSSSSSKLGFTSPISAKQGPRFGSRRHSSRYYGCVARDLSNETTDAHLVETISKDIVLEESVEDLNEDTVEKLLRSREDDVARLMKMERKTVIGSGSDGRWFPYIDMFKAGDSFLTSSEILEALDTLILDVRKERMRKVVENRSYSVCLVVEGLTDFWECFLLVVVLLMLLGFSLFMLLRATTNKRCNRF